MRNGQDVGRAQATMVTDTWGSIQPLEYLNQLCDYHILSIYTPPYIQLSPCTMCLVLNHTLVAIVTATSHPVLHVFDRGCTYVFLRHGLRLTNQLSME
jgi:hypothetical protein